MFKLLEIVKVHRKYRVSILYLKIHSTIKYFEQLYTSKMFYYSSEIKKWYFENNWSQCISLYLSLCSLLHQIFSSHCSNLLNYLKEVIQYWHKLLKSKLTVFVSIYISTTYVIRKNSSAYMRIKFLIEYLKNLFNFLCFAGNTSNY